MADEVVIEERGGVEKGGIIRVQFSIGRSPRWAAGIVLTAKVTPEVEEFMRALGSGDRVAVRTLSRDWSPVGGGADLDIYDMTRPIVPDKGHYYTLNHPGRPFFVDVSGGSGSLTNISWLRLVGISEGSGVTFGVQGPISDTSIKHLRDRLQRDVETFYKAFLRPVKCVVQLSTQEMGGF